jgi:CRP/FNR family transcriptional regulator
MKAASSPAIPECESCPNREISDICQIVPPVEEPFGLIKRRAMYQPGQYVFYEGHVALGLYILCQGQVKLTRLNRKGQQRLVGILDSGQLLEKQAFQEQPVHQVTCEVLESSQICLLDRTTFLSFLKEHGELAVKLVQVLSKEMTAVLNVADQFAFTPARERLARLLLELSDRFGKNEDAGIRMTLKLKREDLAQMAAVTVETVVRLLHDFQNDQLITVHGRELIIINADRLMKIAGISPSR